MAYVGVIGAGLSGLVTIKELIEKGHEVVCFEKHPRLGGIFGNPPNEGPLYDNIHLTVSNYFMAYSSFPPEEPYYKHWSQKEYLEYLEKFAEKFDLNKNIHFNTQIKSVEMIDDKVRVTIKNTNEEFVFDSIAVCSGCFRKPVIPKIKDIERFTGDVIHSHEYKTPSIFQDRNVLCIGSGETAADVVHQVAQTSKSTTLSLRQYPVILRRWPYGGLYPNDAYSSRLFNYIPKSILEYGQIDLSVRQWEKSDDPIEKLIAEWNIKSDKVFNKFFTKNEAFMPDVVDGKLKVNFSGIKTIQEKKITFKDGKEGEFDSILLNTGYSPDFDFLVQNPVKSLQELWHFMIQPDLGTKCVFIGFARPNVGGFPALSELQARYYALLLSGQKKLPSKSILEREIKMDNKIQNEEFCQSKTAPNLVSYFAYADKLAKLVGCSPMTYHLLWRPFLAMKLILGSQTSFHYRLRGPDSNPEMALKMINKLSIAKAPFNHVFKRFFALFFVLTDHIPLLNKFIPFVLRKLDKKKRLYYRNSLANKEMK